MSEGGQLAWKIQKIDVSRGPAADYSAIHAPLPKPPSGVEWKQDEETKEWRLVRSKDDDKQKYKLEVGSAWNARSGREAPTLVPIRKEVAADAAEKNVDDTTEESTKERKAVENVDYLVHTVLPSDTLPGLCLRYKTKATVLRQINRFSGNNLMLAPSRLIIPTLGPDGQCLLDAGKIRAQDTSTPEYKLQNMLAEFPHLIESERRAYLEINDWDLQEAIKSAKEDEEWETNYERKKQQEQQQKTLQPKATPAPRNIMQVHVAIPAVDVDASTWDKSPHEVRSDDNTEPSSELELVKSNHGTTRKQTVREEGDGLMVPLLRNEEIELV